MRRDFPGRRNQYRRNRENTRSELERILVVCEGEKTEPNYFRGFRVPTLDLRVEGEGDHTKNLILRASELGLREEYDQVWCVLDRDSFPAERFNAALEMARSRGIRVAYSNEAFELWYVLHFDYLQAGLPRDRYSEILTERLGRPYEKNSRDMFELLRSRQDTAIRNAQRLLQTYDPVLPERDNPSTTVHLLVEELRRFAR
jgi:hypothetical protein